MVIGVENLATARTEIRPNEASFGKRDGKRVTTSDDARTASAVTTEESMPPSKTPSGTSDTRRIHARNRSHPSAPPWLLGSFYIDFRGEPYNEDTYL